MARSIVLNQDKSQGIMLSRSRFGDKNLDGSAIAKENELYNSLDTTLMADADLQIQGSNGVHTDIDAIHSNMSFTPEYMLELYEKMSKLPPAAHTSDIVRSFQNIAEMGEFFYIIIQFS